MRKQQDQVQQQQQQLQPQQQQVQQQQQQEEQQQQPTAATQEAQNLVKGVERFAAANPEFARQISSQLQAQQMPPLHTHEDVLTHLLPPPPQLQQRQQQRQQQPQQQQQKKRVGRPKKNQQRRVSLPSPGTPMGVDAARNVSAN